MPPPTLPYETRIGTPRVVDSVVVPGSTCSVSHDLTDSASADPTNATPEEVLGESEDSNDPLVDEPIIEGRPCVPPIDHSRRTRHRKTRPNAQRDMFTHYAMQQLEAATSRRPEAVRHSRMVCEPKPSNLGSPLDSVCTKIKEMGGLHESVPSRAPVDDSGESTPTQPVQEARSANPVAGPIGRTDEAPPTPLDAPLAPVVDRPDSRDGVPSKLADEDEDDPMSEAAAAVRPLMAGYSTCALCLLSRLDGPKRLLEAQTSPVGAVTSDDTFVLDCLGPRDLSRCVRYTCDTDDLTDLCTLPSNIFVQALVNDMPFAAILDTGAISTLLHGRIYDELPPDRRPALFPSMVKYASATGRDDFVIRGLASLRITIAGTTGKLWVSVCDNLWSQCLIGRDYMQRFRVTPCLIDLTVKSLHGIAPFYTFLRVEHEGRVLFVDASHRVLETLKVPPRTRLRTWIVTPPRLAARPVLIEPSRHATSRGLMVARAIATPVNGRLPIDVVNLGDEEIVLTDHDELAVLCADIDILLPEQPIPPDIGVNSPTTPVSVAALAPIIVETDSDEAQRAPGMTSKTLLCDRTTPATLVTATSSIVDESIPTIAHEVCRHFDFSASVYGPHMEHHSAFLEFVGEYADRFARHPDDYGRTSILRHVIETDPNAAPIYQRSRPVPLHYVKTVQEEVAAMVRAGIVVPSSSEWSSPIVIVKKKDGGIRICVDYRALNDVTVKDSFPLPRIADLLQSLHGAQLFSSMDLQKGFHQIEMDLASRSKTAFAVPWGLFEYTVMPFGVCNGPSSFQRLVTLALSDCLGVDCLAYIDDILVYAASPTEMLSKLRRVFDRLRTAGLKVKPQKCTFGVPEVSFLGHCINGEGTRMLDDKVEKIRATPRPRNLTELRAFLGLTNYYRDYIAHYAEIAAPLYDLLRKGKSWQWTSDQQMALEAVKTAFTAANGLIHPNPTDLFVLDTDASLEGIGGVLSQIQSGVERIICCASRILSPAERNYDTTRRELLAVVTFCERFSHYLCGAMFVLRTDHAALRWLFHSVEPSQQSSRWISRLADFPMLVIHRPGHLHCNADALSRRPLLLSDGFLTETDGTNPVDLPGPPTPSTAHIDAVLARYGAPPEAASLQELLDQDVDETLRAVKAAVSSEEWPERREVTMRSAEYRAFFAKRRLLDILDGRLVYRRPNHDGLTRVLVVPRIARSSVIAECHGAKTAAHFAERKTLDALRRRFWWPAIKADVRLYCRLCATCQVCAKRTPAGHAPMQVFEAGAPWEVLGMDYIGPVEQTHRRNRHILTMVDHFTRLTVLVPTRNQSTETTIKAVVDKWVAYYGVPRVIHSDRGTSFTSEVMAAVCDRLGVRKTQTTAYRPQADGRVERTNRTVKECLTRLLHEHANDWDELLPQVAMAINSATHEGTGYSPFYLAHGEEMQLPVDLAVPLPPGLYASVPDQVNELLRRLDTAYAIARRHMTSQTERAKRRYDLAARTIAYFVGDQVYYLKATPSAGESRKFYPVWTGPCTVTAVLGDVNVRIKHNTAEWQRVVHVDRLYHQPKDVDPGSPSSSSDMDDSVCDADDPDTGDLTEPPDAMPPATNVEEDDYVRAPSVRPVPIIDARSRSAVDRRRLTTGDTAVLPHGETLDLRPLTSRPVPIIDARSRQQGTLDVRPTPDNVEPHDPDASVLCYLGQSSLSADSSPDIRHPANEDAVADQNDDRPATQRMMSSYISAVYTTHYPPRPFNDDTTTATIHVVPMVATRAPVDAPRGHIRHRSYNTPDSIARRRLYKAPACARSVHSRDLLRIIHSDKSFNSERLTVPDNALLTATDDGRLIAPTTQHTRHRSPTPRISCWYRNMSKPTDAPEVISSDSEQSVSEANDSDISALIADPEISEGAGTGAEATAATDPTADSGHDETAVIAATSNTSIEAALAAETLVQAASDALAAPPLLTDLLPVQPGGALDLTDFLQQPVLTTANPLSRLGPRRPISTTFVNPGPAPAAVDHTTDQPATDDDEDLIDRAFAPRRQSQSTLSTAPVMRYIPYFNPDNNIVIDGRFMTMNIQVVERLAAGIEGSTKAETLVHEHQRSGGVQIYLRYPCVSRFAQFKLLNELRGTWLHIERPNGDITAGFDLASQAEFTYSLSYLDQPDDPVPCQPRYLVTRHDFALKHRGTCAASKSERVLYLKVANPAQLDSLPYEVTTGHKLFRRLRRGREIASPLPNAPSTSSKRITHTPSDHNIEIIYAVRSGDDFNTDICQVAAAHAYLVALVSWDEYRVVAMSTALENDILDFFRHVRQPLTRDVRRHLSWYFDKQRELYEAPQARAVRQATYTHDVIKALYMSFPIAARLISMAQQEIKDPLAFLHQLRESAFVPLLRTVAGAPSFGAFTRVNPQGTRKVLSSSTPVGAHGTTPSTSASAAAPTPYVSVEPERPIRATRSSKRQRLHEHGRSPSTPPPIAAQSSGRAHRRRSRVSAGSTEEPHVETTDAEHITAPNVAAGTPPRTPPAPVPPPASSGPDPAQTVALGLQLSPISPAPMQAPGDTVIQSPTPHGTVEQTIRRIEEFLGTEPAIATTIQNTDVSSATRLLAAHADRLASLERAVLRPLVAQLAIDSDNLSLRDQLHAAMSANTQLRADNESLRAAVAAATQEADVLRADLTNRSRLTPSTSDQHSQTMPTASTSTPPSLHPTVQRLLQPLAGTVELCTAVTAVIDPEDEVTRWFHALIDAPIFPTIHRPSGTMLLRLLQRLLTARPPKST